MVNPFKVILFAASLKTGFAPRSMPPSPMTIVCPSFSAMIISDLSMVGFSVYMPFLTRMVSPDEAFSAAAPIVG